MPDLLGHLRSKRHSTVLRSGYNSQANTGHPNRYLLVLGTPDSGNWTNCQQCGKPRESSYHDVVLPITIGLSLGNARLDCRKRGGYVTRNTNGR
jgi:hypothetical protein